MLKTNTILKFQLLLVTIILINATKTKPIKTNTQIKLDDEGSDKKLKLYTEMNSARHKRAWRLPNTTYPLHYQLHLTTHVHREIYEYTGECTIDILVQANTTELVLHAMQLEILNISIKDLTAEETRNNVRHRQISDLLIIESDNSEGSVAYVRHHYLRVIILYTGVIRRDSVLGLHRISYEDATLNRTVYGAATLFSPIFARTMLPCYDEPAFKSRFSLRLTHGTNYTALSNMPQLRTTFDSANNMTTTIFMDTPVMSTYLLAFFVSNYINTTTMHDVIEPCVLPPPNSKLHARIPLCNAKKALDVFGKFLDMPFGLPKLDHIAEHNTYYNAMENWGLIIYNVSLFPQENETNVVKNFTYIITQSHELVHQWFGNLVSPAWWNFLWLKESFATYYSYYLTDLIYPEFKAPDIFSLDVCYNYLKRTEDETSMSHYIEEPLDIKKGFGIVSYKKAPCIIQMFEHALNQSVFRKGISNYLKKHSFSVANEDDLFEALQTVVLDNYSAQNRTWNYNLHNIMKSWTHAKSFPIVAITRNYENNSINIRQFSSTENSTELWWIPLNFVTASQPNFDNTIADMYMPPIQELTINLSDLNIDLQHDDWLIANKLGKGFYYVMYDMENLRRISATLQRDHNIIHRSNRAFLLHGLKNYIRHMENFNMITVLELFKYLRNEEEPIVWISFISFMLPLIDNLKDTKIQDLIENYIGNISRPIYQFYNSKPNIILSLTETKILKDLDKLECILELPECLLEKKELILGRITNSKPITDADDTLLCFAAKAFNDEEFELVWQYLVKTNKVQAWDMLWSMLCTNNPKQYAKALNLAFDFEQDDQTDETYCKSRFELLSSLMTLSYTRNKEITWQMLDKHLPHIMETTACQVDVLCDNFLKESEYVENKPKYIKYLELCQLHEMLNNGNVTKYDWKEVRIGGEISRSHQLRDKILSNEVYQWLQAENEKII